MNVGIGHWADLVTVSFVLTVCACGRSAGLTAVKQSLGQSDPVISG